MVKKLPGTRYATEINIKTINTSNNTCKWHLSLRAEFCDHIHGMFLSRVEKPARTPVGLDVDGYERTFFTAKNAVTINRVILIGELFFQNFDVFFAQFFNLPYFPVFFQILEC